MGATNQTSLNAPAARPSPTPLAKSTRPTRPGMITSNARGISYRSKSGRMLTFEFSTPSARPTEDPFNKFGPLTESTPSSTSPATDNGDTKPAAASTKPRSTLPAKAAAAAAVVSSAQLPHTAELVVRRGSFASTKSNTSAKTATKKVDEDAPVEPGVLVGIYDTLSFWCMEAVEVACWGPYDEAPRTPGPSVLSKAAAAAATVEAAKA